MARPGLKSPPRHAVVIRLGDAPAGEIPKARTSRPPPEPEPVTLRRPREEQPTLRAIPNASSSPLPAPVHVGQPGASELGPPASAPVSAGPPASPPRLVESQPPPSDMPVVASIPAPRSSRRASTGRSRFTIAVAAAAGLVLGLISVAATRYGASGGASVGASPGGMATLLGVDGQPSVRALGAAGPGAPSASDQQAAVGAKQAPASAASAPPAASVVTEPRSDSDSSAAPKRPPAAGTPRRSIF
jgi:hypothetical protein